MIELDGDPDCKVCYGSGVMPDYHWVEPCMRCHPVTEQELKEGNRFMFVALIVLVATLVFTQLMR